MRLRDKADSVKSFYAAQYLSVLESSGFLYFQLSNLQCLGGDGGGQALYDARVAVCCTVSGGVSSGEVAMKEVLDPVFSITWDLL